MGAGVGVSVGDGMGVSVAATVGLGGTGVAVAGIVVAVTVTVVETVAVGVGVLVLPLASHSVPFGYRIPFCALGSPQPLKQLLFGWQVPSSIAELSPVAMTRPEPYVLREMNAPVVPVLEAPVI